MANNPYVNKVQKADGTTIIDISDSTAIASDVASGKYFYLSTGQKVQGTASGGGTPAISVVDTTDSAGGTIRTITALDISDTTAVASDVASGKYFYTANGTKTVGTASGGGGGAYTCTLTNSGSSDGGIYVKYNNTKYYTSNDSFDFNANDTLSITVNYGNSNAVRVNGTIIAGGSGQFVTNYSYTLPACSISVTFTQGRSYSYIDISVPLHTIHLEFTDSTDTDIDVYYDDALISTMITAYEPTTYGQKTVSLAQLDGVTWYEPSAIPLNTQLIDYSALVAGYIIDASDGQEHASQWSCCSDFTKIDPSMTFNFVGYQWYDMAFYDSNKTFISGVTQDDYADTVENDYAHGTLSGARIPSTAVYVRLSSYPNAGISSTQLSLIRTA